MTTCMLIVHTYQGEQFHEGPREGCRKCDGKPDKHNRRVLYLKGDAALRRGGNGVRRNYEEGRPSG